MVTEYRTWMACPTCGYIAEIATEPIRYCIKCRLEDVHHRMMTVPELLLFAARAFRSSKDRMMDRVHGITINLIRYATIWECLGIVQTTSENDHSVSMLVGLLKDLTND